MIAINQQKPISYAPNFAQKEKASDSSTAYKKKYNTTAVVGFATAIGLTTAGILSRKSRKQMVEKAGIELRDKFAYIKGTDKKFTGTLKRNISPFGLKKEVVEIEDGMLKEILNYGFNNRELDGYFYKNGKIFYSSTSSTGAKEGLFAIYKYDENGNIVTSADAYKKPKDSIFDHMRKLVQKES